MWRLKKEFGFKLQRDLKHNQNLVVNYSVHCFYIDKGHKLTLCTEGFPVCLLSKSLRFTNRSSTSVHYIFDLSGLKPCVLAFVVYTVVLCHKIILKQEKICIKWNAPFSLPKLLGNSRYWRRREEQNFNMKSKWRSDGKDWRSRGRGRSRREQLLKKKGDKSLKRRR